MTNQNGEVIKSPRDNREYKIVHLPNGLTAVLVHDPNVSSHVDDADGEQIDRTRIMNAAAAMCVAVGSFSDPPDVPGLAHLLEHVLDSGSLEFPDTNEWRIHISTNGGASNAATYNDYTCYYFHINGPFLKPSLDRFSQFFISPLLKAEAVLTEIEAVNSEFHLRKRDQSQRLLQVQRHTSVAGHPFSRFVWGNQETFMSKGIDFLRKQLSDFFYENYVAERMKLVVIGGEPLNLLEEYVVELFSNVRKGIPKNLDFHSTGKVLEAGKICWVESVKHVHDMRLSWQVPCLNKDYLKKPFKYLSHLIGHKGCGSLFSLLKRKGWATFLSSLLETSPDLFILNIELTNLGLQKIYEVTGAVYQYIKLLEDVGPQEWIFKELGVITNLKFIFPELQYRESKQSQYGFASDIAKNLLVYSEEDVLHGEFVFQTWDPNLISESLSFLKPQNMRIDILTKSLPCDSSNVRHEPWFGVPYIVEEIPFPMLEDWTKPLLRDSSLHLPLKNDYIPEHYCTTNLTALKDFEQDPEIPNCVIVDHLIKVWYKEVNNIPNADAYFIITCENASEFPPVKSTVLSEMYASLLSDALLEILYQAEVAQLHTRICSTAPCIFKIEIYGLSEKLPLLASDILKFVKTFQPTEESFDFVREDMERRYKNASMESKTHSQYLSKLPNVDNKLSCLLSLSNPDMTTFVSDLFRFVDIIGLCHGKLSKVDVDKIADSFKDTFASALPAGIQLDYQNLSLPHGAREIKNEDVKNKSDVNSSVQINFQLDPVSTRAQAMANLFWYIVQEPFYRELRTKEQLGYSVSCSPTLYTSHVGLSFTVKSSKHSPPFLQERVDKFIDNLPQILTEMNDEAFQNHKNNAIKTKLLPKSSLYQETQRYWNEIVKGTFFFGGDDELELEEVKKLEKSDVIDWYNSYLNSNSADCTRMCIRVWGYNSRKRKQSESEASGSGGRKQSQFEGSGSGGF